MGDVLLHGRGGIDKWELHYDGPLHFAGRKFDTDKLAEVLLRLGQAGCPACAGNQARKLWKWNRLVAMI